MIGWAGPSGLPGAGRAIADAGCSAGNQLTLTGFERRSQVRGAVEISTLPLSPLASEAGRARERTGVFSVRRRWAFPWRTRSTRTGRVEANLDGLAVADLEPALGRAGLRGDQR